MGDNKWFSYFKYDNGIITCRFDKRIKTYYLNKKIFLISDLRMIWPSVPATLKGFIYYSKSMSMIL